MSPTTRALSLVVFAALVLTGCGSPSVSGSDSAARHARFEAASCPFPLSGSLFKKSEIRCGYLVVPENRQQDSGKTIQLAVAVFKSPSHRPAPDPLVYLEGGPGSPLVGTMGFSIAQSGMPDYVGNRNLILVDQRGAGLSKPSLDCDADESWSVCRARLARERIDLAAYNTVESAADIAALGPALGYKQVNLFGNSYGTTLALQVMRDYPKRIRAVVMDGITGPTFNDMNGYNAYIWYGLRRIFKDCAAAPTCKTNHPHLQQTFTHLLARLQAHPATVEGVSRRLGRTVSATMTGLGLWATMREFVADPTGPPLVPLTIDSFAAGDYTMAVQFVGNTLSEGSTTESLGMHYLMDCSGEPLASPSSIATHSQMVPDSIRSAAIANMVGYLENCQDWYVPKISAVNHTYFRSAIPTLLLPGRYDPKTPPSLAAALAPKLGHAYLIEIPTLSHMVVGYDWCPDSISRAFLAHPGRMPNARCVADMSLTWY